MVEDQIVFSYPIVKRFLSLMCMNRRSLSVLPLLVFWSTSAFAEVNLSTWIHQASGLFAETPQSLSLAQTIRSSKHGREAAHRESPFTVQSTWSRIGLQDPGVASPWRKTVDWSLANQLRYQPRIGVEATLGVNTNFLDTSSGSLSDSINRPYALSTRLAYDILQGGLSGREKTREKANVELELQNLHSAQAEWLTTKIQFIGQMIDLYVSECKTQQLAAARSVVAETVKSGRVQVKIKTLSYKDFLNFLDLENSFARRLATEEATRAAYFERLLDYGQTVSDVAAQLLKRNPICKPGFKEIEVRANESRMDDASIRRLALFIPSMLAAENAKKTAQFQLRLTKLANRPNLSPFVGMDYARQEASTGALWSYTTGIGFEWNVAGPRGSYSVSSAEAELSAAGHQVERAFLDAVSMLRALQAQVRSQENVLLVLKASLETSRKLLETLNAQFAIGHIDSINLTTAMINGIDASNALVDSWGALEKTVYQIDLYQNWKKSRDAGIQ